jgi:hypothetical protein
VKNKPTDADDDGKPENAKQAKKANKQGEKQQQKGGKKKGAKPDEPKNSQSEDEVKDAGGSDQGIPDGFVVEKTEKTVFKPKKNCTCK